MHRRKLLAGAAIAGSAAVGGCLTSARTSEPGEDDGGDGRSERESGDEKFPDGDEFSVETSGTDCEPSSSKYPVQTGSLDEYSPAGTYEELVVGSREGMDDSIRPHDVQVWSADVTTKVTLRIIDADDESVSHHETYEIPEDREVSISLVEPSNYLIEVTARSIAAEQTLHLPCTYFDCNSSGTQIGILQEGIESRVYSTLAMCG